MIQRHSVVRASAKITASTPPKTPRGTKGGKIMKFLLLAGTVLFVVGAIAETRSTHTVWDQNSVFWMLLGFAAIALDVALSGSKYGKHLQR
jgi:hypothetical protein